MNDRLVDLAVILGADSGEEMRIMQKGKIVDGDHRFDRRIERRDEIGAVQQIEAKTQQLCHQ
mgnify:CR=1 FL=1